MCRPDVCELKGCFSGWSDLPGLCHACWLLLCLWWGWHEVSHLLLEWDPWPPLGYFHQKWLYGICSLLKPLLTFMEGTSLFPLQMPWLWGHPWGIWWRDARAGHRGPLHIHSPKPGPGGPTAAGHHAVRGEVSVASVVLWWEGASFNSYIEIKTISSKVKHLGRRKMAAV